MRMYLVETNVQLYLILILFVHGPLQYTFDTFLVLQVTQILQSLMLLPKATVYKETLNPFNFDNHKCVQLIVSNASIQWNQMQSM